MTDPGYSPGYYGKSKQLADEASVPWPGRMGRAPMQSWPPSPGDATLAVAESKSEAALPAAKARDTPPGSFRP